MDEGQRPDNPPLDADFVAAAKKQLETTKRRLDSIGQQIEQLRKEQENLLRVAISLENLVANASGGWEHGPSEPTALDSGGGSRSDSPSGTTQGRDQADLAADVLDGQGKDPMHYKQLAEEVRRRGGQLLGQDPAAVLNAILNRDDRFVRPFRRGYYALRKHYPDLKRNVGARRRGRNSGA